VFLDSSDRASSAAQRVDVAAIAPLAREPIDAAAIREAMRIAPAGLPS
jgi:hypothetical protein